MAVTGHKSLSRAAGPLLPRRSLLTTTATLMPRRTRLATLQFVGAMLGYTTILALTLSLSQVSGS